ncbi:mRNA 3'-end-processing protein rna14 [Paramarasmius palmivorus]|uniref:mRNA 3'-end-processing protein RNA14 n=1 Tax=Paramarasmius palmivorus TaxID=297713 RepID=A0AAW0BE72_9AGAR
MNSFPSQNPGSASEVNEILQHLKEHPHEVEDWSRVLSFAEHSHGPQSLKIYDAALKSFPCNPAIQLAYIIKATSNGDHRKLEQYFKLCLEKSTPSIELCNLYLDFVRENRSDILLDSYKDVLDIVGHEVESCEIWDQYLMLLQQVGKCQALRETLHRVVKTPLRNLPEFWERVTAFEYEHEHEHTDAEEVLEELLTGHVRALAVLRDYQLSMELVHPVTTSNSTSLSSLPLSPDSPWGEKLVERWIDYLKWEEGDPLELQGNDSVAFMKRLRTAYGKATCKMWFYPEIWDIVYRGWMKMNHPDEALIQLHRGLSANPTSPLLTFSLASALEARGDPHSGREVYEGVLRALRNSLDSNGSSFLQEKVSGLRRDLGLAYISYMRFANRTRGMNAVRSVFSSAQSDAPLTPWVVYEAAAKMEYVHDGDDGLARATEIFEAGMAHFRNDSGYITCYLEWLISVDDRNNVKILINTVVDHFPATIGLQLWERWLRYAYLSGDFDYLLDTEKLVRIYRTELDELQPSLPITRIPTRRIRNRASDDWEEEEFEES